MSKKSIVEECVDDLDEIVGALERYPPAVLTIALRVHLAGLLRILREQGEWSDSQMHDFLQDLSGEVLESSGE